MANKNRLISSVQYEVTATAAWRAAIRLGIWMCARIKSDYKQTSWSDGRGKAPRADAPERPTGALRDRDVTAWRAW